MSGAPETQASEEMKLDIIGDIHGELGALSALGRELGYDVDRDWRHPEGRVAVFLGDLVDRGAHSLEVVEQVMAMVEQERAACIMGNHEYNLVANSLGLPGYLEPKSSNAPTIASMERNPTRWRRPLEFLRTLPLGFVLPDLRIIHACWHVASYSAVKAILEPRSFAAGGPLRGFVALDSPFTDRGLKEGLEPGDKTEREDSPHEILIKGFELPAAQPFRDSEGTLRDKIRATWWKGGDALVLRDRPQVIGHYWNLPPVDGNFCPPYPSGHPELKAWQREVLKRTPARGTVAFTGDIACVDFNGVTAASTDGRACVGALRWPEREIVWASAPRTRARVRP